jgi:methylenetetrahydrofolate--tRNA-(uracil-5-)-methyltransferase
MRGAVVIGAGLAGCEAAWQLAKRDVPVTLYEMKPARKTPAHRSDSFCELVCSNSLRSDELTNAVGLLKEEMRLLGSVVIEAADRHRVAAGGALAVDREAFADAVTGAVKNHPNIEVVCRHVDKIPRDAPAIVAAGPLATGELCADIHELVGRDALWFYDAAAPIVSFGSIDMDSAYFASRYNKGTADYVNCPMTKEEYDAFYEALVSAETVPLHEFEAFKTFEGCMPVEVMAKRGRDTLRFGPLKPVGLTDPRRPDFRAYAVVQLRRDNKEGRLYNIVGFQTHLKFPEQKRVFSMIPALRNAQFVRYGVMHRNTYINSPGLLDEFYRLKSNPDIFFAGQITGVEGYVESAASGLCAGLNLARVLQGRKPVDFGRKTAIGALAHYVSDESVAAFQPMNVNFGIMEPLPQRVKGKRAKNGEISKRALLERSALLAESGEGKEKADENHC